MCTQSHCAPKFILETPKLIEVIQEDNDLLGCIFIKDSKNFFKY